MSGMRTSTAIGVGVLIAAAAAILSCRSATRARLEGSQRGETKSGWIPIRLEGSPAQIGYQHGYLLAAEIDDALKVIKLSITHQTKRDWAFFRTTAKDVLWPHIEDEYREELRGIANGLAARSVDADVWDVVALNANIELTYYTDVLDAKKQSSAPEKCSAFVATGSWTRDGRPVIAHNNWSGYLEGERWNIIFDIRPENGHRILMDGFPGLIHSGDDFGMNDAGIVITETTISGFHGFDPGGVPEFVRARKAMQYAASIDDFDRIMRAGNNGGYANTWLLADVKTGEIARLELGLKHVTLERTRDGYFAGANFPIDPKLTAEETSFIPTDPTISGCARRARFERLMPTLKGQLDVAAAKLIMADHVDAAEGNTDAPSEHTLCGHVDLSPRGMKPWQDEFGPAGTVQAKVADATGVEHMELEAAIGHPCGVSFVAAEHLARHPEFAWQKELLRDLPSQPWTSFSAR
jgi:hypothetical protein